MVKTRFISIETFDFKIYAGMIKNQNTIINTIKSAIKIVFIFSSTCEFISSTFLTKRKRDHYLNTFFADTSTQTYVTAKQVRTLNC